MQAFTAEKTELLATYGADANRGLTEAQAQKNKEQYLSLIHISEPTRH